MVGAQPARESLRLDRFDKKHFIGRAEACGFVEAAAFFGRMQSDDADAAAARLGEGQVDEIAGQATAAVFGLDVDVEEIAARGGARVEGVRGPVEEEEADAGDDFAILFSEPAEVAAVGDGLRDPRLVGLRHELEDRIVAAAGVDEHAATVAGDEWSVGSGRQPRLEHDEQYKT